MLVDYAESDSEKDDSPAPVAKSTEQLKRQLKKLRHNQNKLKIGFFINYEANESGDYRKKSVSDDDESAVMDEASVRKKPEVADNTNLLNLLPRPKGTVVPLSAKSTSILLPTVLVRKSAAIDAKVPAVKRKHSDATQVADHHHQEHQDETHNYFSFYNHREVTPEESVPSRSLLIADLPNYATYGPSLMNSNEMPEPLLGATCQQNDDDVPEFLDPNKKNNSIPWRHRNPPDDVGSLPDIIDIHQEDLTRGASIELTKGLTMDREDQGYAKPDPSEAPSKLAARKHQITWLAFKAKEEAFEMQNTWASNRANQRASRNKYGF